MIANIDKAQIKEIIERRLEKANTFPSFDKAVDRLSEGRPLKIYLGIDPTGPDIHIGHTIPLLFLKDLLGLGHKPVILIGSFTAKIGDPSGKEAARKPMTDEEINENMSGYLDQIYKILPRGSFDLKYNGDWLSKLTFEDVIRYASYFSVQQMLARDMFQERIKREKPIYLNEFLYPLAQGYDSVAMEIDGEVGGNDQVFNMLIGRDLEKELLDKDKLVFATRLLVNSQGKKMSKSEGGRIAISDSPQDIFGKTMAFVPDEMIKTVFELCTEKDLEWIVERQKSVDSGENPKNFKEDLAFELVKMYYDEEKAEKARKEFKNVFSKGGLPNSIKGVKGVGLEIVDFIKTNGLADSASEAKRLIDQGAVSVGGEIVKDWGYELKKGDMVKVGPRKFLRVD